MNGNGTTAPAPLSNVELIQSRIIELQEALQKNLPNYESLLHTIHVALQKDDELVHLLKEEEIGVIVSGLCKKKNIVIALATKAGGKNTTSSGKKLKDVNLGDLM